MKICLVASFIVVIVTIGSVGATGCKNDSDCGEDECCAKILKWRACRKLLKEGNLCFPFSFLNYKPRCHCGEGLKCVVNRGLFRCTKVTSTTTTVENKSPSTIVETTQSEIVTTPEPEVDETPEPEIDETSEPEVEETTHPEE